MKAMKVVFVVSALLLGGVVLGLAATSRGQAPAPAPGVTPTTDARDIEVTKTPALLLAPGTKTSDLAVYGVKLGDSVDKIPTAAGVARQPSERPQDAFYTGRNVWYYAYEGKIYHIRVLGEIVKDLPPYDPTRLQIALGKADELFQPELEQIRLSYFARHIQFTFRGTKLVSEVDFYAP